MIFDAKLFRKFNMSMGKTLKHGRVLGRIFRQSEYFIGKVDFGSVI